MRTIKKSDLMARLGQFRSVENTESRNGEGYAPNQFEISFENGTVFQSYRTLIAARIGDQYYFSGDHCCSNTTGRHCTRWCGFTSRERRKGLDNESFVLITE